MKKARLFALLFVILCFICGCSLLTRVETLKGWMFQENSGTSDYSLLFGLCDSQERDLAADCTVAIRIVNDNNETVYSKTKNITTKDFSNFTGVLIGERYFADVRIASSEIAPGTTSSGTVYFTVKGEDFSFDEVNCSAFDCLPVKDVTLIVDELPVQVRYKGIMSKDSVYNITDVSYVSDYSLYSGCIQFVVSGEMVSGPSDSYSTYIGYKLYDSEQYMVESGMISLGSRLSVGDKFRSDIEYIYNLVPGETYTLVLTDYGW